MSTFTKIGQEVSTAHEFHNWKNKATFHVNIQIQFDGKNNICNCFLIERSFPRVSKSLASRIHSYFDNVMTKFMINNRTDAWKTDVNLLISFPFTSLHDWLKKLAPLSNPIRGKNQKQSWLACTRFPALRVRDINYFQFLIGSLYRLRLLWLATVITLA